MIDGIIKADGTSRLMRAELPATYEEFRAQCRAGTQPLDVLFNALGWSQLPTFLNKANLLKDATAALFGLSSDAVPDDVLSLLSRFQSSLGSEYVWAKKEDYLADVIVQATTTTTVQFGNTITVYTDMSLVNGSIVLSGSKSVSYGQGANYYAYYGGKPYYLEKFQSYGDSKSKYTAYLLSVGQESRLRTVGYVNSPDLSAYPVDDGYTYELVGQLGETTRYGTGSYAGTGKTGTVSVNLGVKPKLVILYCSYNNTSYVNDSGLILTPIVSFSFNDSGNFYASQTSGVTASGITETGFKVFVSNDTLGLNVSGQTYNYWYIY